MDCKKSKQFEARQQRSSVGCEVIKPAVANLSNRFGVGVALADTAHVHITLNLEESIVAPRSSPRILNEPVIQARGLILTVSNRQNSMVHITGAVCAGS